MAVKYRVGIIGTGRMGGLIEDELAPGEMSASRPYGHVPAYMAIDETEVVAIANRSSDRMQRFGERFGITNTFLDYREMIDTQHLDIVSVTTPSFARAEPLIYAAEHGVRAIYSEKGLCASLAEADRIREVLKANGVAFNWGAMRRHDVGYRALAAAIAAGDIGEPQIALMYTYTDLIKHHPHTLDTVSMLLGDPAPDWVAGRLIDADDSFDPEPRRPVPLFDSAHNKFLPSPGYEIADPYVGAFQVGYRNGVVGHFIPHRGFFDVEVRGEKGRAYALDNGKVIGLRRSGAPEAESGMYGTETSDRTFFKFGESPTINIIRDLIHSMETGKSTRGNIDVTMNSVEVQFALALSHLDGGTRVEIPVADRSLYIPGG